MTPPPLSSLGDKYALFLGQIRPRWQSVHLKLLTLASSASSLSSSFSSTTSFSVSSAQTTPIAVTVILAGILIAIIMVWHSPLTNLLRRSSPYTTVSNPPYVSDQDYSYISPDDGHNGNDEDDENEPDTLLLKHRKHTYELHFPAYAINDGTLTVGQLRKRAAEVTRTADPQRIVLLYKGVILQKDAVPCRSEGLKQDSEVLCVVSEVEPGEGTPSEGSDVDIPVRGGGGAAHENAEQQQQQPTRTRTRNRNRNKKKPGKKGSKKETTAPPPTESPRPAPTPTPTASSGSSSLPPPAPNLKNFATAREQVEALREYLRRELVGPCEAYARAPPVEEKARVFEHRKLSETILAQVILKADGIEPSGDAETRTARKELIREAQAALGLLDRVG